MSLSLAVLDRLSLMAVLCDAEDVVSYVNPLVRASKCLTRGETFGPATLPETIRLIRSPLVQSDRFTTALDLGDRHRLVEWSISPFRDGQTLYIGKDVTRDRKAYAIMRDLARKASDASDTKMRFLATMSHEMRTPLNGILGMNGLLLDTDLSANQRTYSEAIHQSGTALLALINDILDYSKIEAGHLELEEHWFDPSALLQSITELLAPKAEEKGLEIAACWDPDLPGRIYGDEARLRQVLLNLAGNGVKFTETGGVGLELRASEGQKEGTVRLQFDVRDSGIGISEENLRRVFEEFTQVDDSTARGHEGTGLGLSIARQIVSAMGGEITAHSKLGKGSTFSFAIDVRSEPASLSATDIPMGTVVGATANPVLRRILSQQLEAISTVSVWFASDAATALSRLSTNSAATLLCDLPIAQSHEAAALAAASENAIVLLSSRTRGRLESFRDAGFHGYLIKPIRQVSLIERLRPPSDRVMSADDRTRATESQNAYAVGDRRKRILLAEDNQINSVLAQTILKRAGHHVDLAYNGQEALDTFALAPYDIVLMDMRMPVMDGLTAARRLRERHGEAVPIIALTANASSADRRECEGAGMVDFVSKPFEPQHLLDAIERWTSDRVSGGASALKVPNTAVQ